MPLVIEVHFNNHKLMPFIFTKTLRQFLIFSAFALIAAPVTGADVLFAPPGEDKVYELWEPAPAPNSGAAFVEKERREYPYDHDWEYWSYPLGNGHMGANIFGRVDSERIQITEKTLHNIGIYERGGLTSFAEINLDFEPGEISDYRRSLNLDEGIAHVSYQRDGVRHTREYFMSYPDRVLVVRLTADTKGAISFILKPKIAFLDQADRTGTVVASGDLVTLAGHMPYLDINFEGQIKVLNEGGSLTSATTSGGSQIKISNADSVTLIFAAGSNYELNAQRFESYPNNKLNPNRFPDEAVSATIQSAENKGFTTLKRRHLDDYQNLFGRVSLKLDSEPSPLPTHELLAEYKDGQTDNWLEELMFQYGRYLLISSSRETSLPANLQGTWSQYHYTPWTGGYWHNINLQMNYWGAFSANLAEAFEAYIKFYEAYLPVAEKMATEYVEKYRPGNLSEEPGGNGWIVGSGANNYYLPFAGWGHSGPGTGGMTVKLFAEYYHFTQDTDYLKEIGYPALRSMSRFFSKSLQPQDDDTLLVYPSASPEIKVNDPEQLEGIENAGTIMDRGYYRTIGATFDQWAVWEVYEETLEAAKVLDQEGSFTEMIEAQQKRLDPILIGSSGQIKEFREETHYGSIGNPKHRHISHLCALYPGTLIDDAHEDWQAAASKTLDFRGNDTTGWAMAHRMNARARLDEGEKAHAVYQKLIAEKTTPNLWTLHPPFQIDASLGLVAGVAEMLLQSHEDYIEPLPALPKAWSDHGHFDGLVARGNFLVSVEWSEGQVTRMAITSRAGGECRIRYPDIDSASIVDGHGRPVESASDGAGQIRFETTQGETYHIL